MTEENYNDLDRRIRRTKLSFKNHFINLIIEKGYRSVSVKDIVERADYNRSTFYHYYKDKEDLTEELITDMLVNMEISFQLPFVSMEDIEVNSIIPKNIALFDHIYENRNFYSLLKLPDTIPGLPEKIINKIRTLYDTFIFKNETKEKLTQEHLKIYISYGEYGLILEWIKNDYDKSPLELAENMLDILTNHIHSMRVGS